jgi:hypothetical protein
MEEKFIVIQSGNTGHAGTRVDYFDAPDEATRHIETCLEAGDPREGINIYRATRLTMQVKERPVVSLEDPSADSLTTQDATRDPEPPSERNSVPEFARFEMTEREGPPTMPNADPEAEARRETATPGVKKTS